MHRRTAVRGRVRLVAVGAIALVGVLTFVGALAGCASQPEGPSSAATSAPATDSPGSAASTATGPTPSAAPLPEVPIRDSSAGAQPSVPVVPPVSLTIAALGIEVPIDPVGVAADGQMEIPPLAERAGWYRFGAAPGDPAGTAVIAAHVDSVASAGTGPFVRLGDAAVGDVVDVELAGGATAQYTVSAVVRVAKPDARWPEIFQEGGEPRLVMITCGGAFQRDEGHYSDNVIVTAVPVGAP